MSEEEQKLEKEYDQDLSDMVKAYRTWKNGFKFLGKVFAFLLLVASLIVAAREALKK
jgi:hypothetical protein